MHATERAHPVGLAVATPPDIVVGNQGIAIRQYAVDRLIEGIIVAGQQAIEESGQRRSIFTVAGIAYLAFPGEMRSDAAIQCPWAGDCFAAALLAMTKTVQPYGIMFKAVLRAFTERATTSLTSPCAARRQPKAIYCAEFRNVPKFLGAVRLWAASGDSRDVPVSGGDLHA